MRSIYFIALLNVLLVSGTSWAVEEKVVGSVVAVERSFGSAQLNQCKEKFETDLPGFEFSCTVNLLSIAAYEQLISYDEFLAPSSPANPCRVSLYSTRTGYRIVVKSTSFSPRQQLNQAEAWKCVQSAYLSMGWGNVELKSKVFTVR